MTTNKILINDEIIEKTKKSGMETISISIDGLIHYNFSLKVAYI